ncbi:hypothetical protein [Sulfoacidibacillus ferrooxidans]|nr:hypothetical protein [Sulfoacidibacillus ferrooxidans]
MGYNYVVVANNDKTRITNSDLPPQEFLDELFYYTDGLELSPYNGVNSVDALGDIMYECHLVPLW